MSTEIIQKENITSEKEVNDSIIETKNSEKSQLANQGHTNSLEKYRFFIFSYGAFFLIILILCIIALIITGARPCVHTKCHENAKCINHPFYAECICDYGFPGNGRDHCDECGITYYKNNADEDGQRANPYSWPATAIIEYTYTALVKLEASRVLLYDQGMCGGVLINRKHILTSANCIKEQIETYDYISGNLIKINVTLNNFHPSLDSIYNIYMGTDEYVYYFADLPHVVVEDFDKVIIHPEYNRKTLENNLAILKLNNEADLNRYVQITCLPNATSSNIPDVYMGHNSLYIAGYSSSGSSYTTYAMQNLILDMYNTSMCSTVQPNNTKNWDGQFCAGEYNTYGNTSGVCHGDYGSALYTPYEVNGIIKYVTTGILSYDVPCSTLHSPAVYTRISYYLDWILENTKY
ncbi:unnamed protein product [Brachionus calyciflorus]|uniref:Peptidase S1 domain-containing protein n=1 Tax=Brachionus calyciflorus TaxID=104777 RepID=A0A814AL22_9BILA|nr:unnamed protein product [Brachionus calyciflorus]